MMPFPAILLLEEVFAATECVAFDTTDISTLSCVSLSVTIFFWNCFLLFMMCSFIHQLQPDSIVVMLSHLENFFLFFSTNWWNPLQPLDHSHPMGRIYKLLGCCCFFSLFCMFVVLPMAGSGHEKTHISFKHNSIIKENTPKKPQRSHMEIYKTSSQVKTAQWWMKVCLVLIEVGKFTLQLWSRSEQMRAKMAKRWN